jgi:hypothetical protein
VYLLCVHRELELRYSSYEMRCCLRLAVAIAIGILGVLCSGLKRERYPFLIALREPLRRRDCVSFNRSTNMLKLVIVFISLVVPLGSRGVMSELVIRVGVDTGRSQAGDLRAEKQFRGVGICRKHVGGRPDDLFEANEDFTVYIAVVDPQKTTGVSGKLLMAAAATTDS